MPGVMAGGGGRLEELLALSTLAFFLASSPEELDLSDLSSWEVSQTEPEDLPLVLTIGVGPLFSLRPAPLAPPVGR
jgi:hypothetical protein